MSKWRQCSKCKAFGHNVRTCKMSDKEARKREKERAAFEKRREERAEAEHKALHAALIDAVNMLGNVAGVSMYLESGDPFSGVVLELPIEGVNIENTEAGAVMLTAIAGKIAELEARVKPEGGE